MADFERNKPVKIAPKKMTDQEVWERMAQGYILGFPCPHGIPMHCMEHLNDCWACTAEVRKIHQQQKEAKAWERAQAPPEPEG